VLHNAKQHVGICCVFLVCLVRSVFHLTEIVHSVAISDRRGFLLPVGKNGRITHWYRSCRAIAALHTVPPLASISIRIRYAGLVVGLDNELSMWRTISARVPARVPSASPARLQTRLDRAAVNMQFLRCLQLTPPECFASPSSHGQPSKV